MQRARVIGAWALLIAALIAWPVTALTVFREEPQGVLGLSYLAIVIESLSLLTSSQVRQQQDRDP